MAKVTLHDVAAYAGTSITSVSRVLSDPAYPVAVQTQERILDAVKKLGYIKPISASRYRHKNDVMEIGVILPTISNPFYAMALTGIKSKFQSWGYNVLIYDSYRSPENELNLLRSLRQKGIVGVILSSLQTDGKALREFTNLGMKIILLDQKVYNTDCDHISFEYSEGARQAVRFLYGIGQTCSSWGRFETNRRRVRFCVRA